jgi:hypothetical protein
LTPEAELLDVVAAERRKVAAHPGWQTGPERILELLQTATRIRQLDRTNFGHDVPWETVFGLLITWHHKFPVATGPVSPQHADELVLAAATLARLEGLELSSRVNAYRVRKRGSALVLTHRWNPALEVADAILERNTTPPHIPELTSAERAWIDRKALRSRDLPPLQVLRAAAARAREGITLWREHQLEGALPESFSLGDGLTVGDAIDVLAGLMGFADLCMATADIQKRTETTLVTLSTTTFSDLLVKLAPNCDRTQVDNVIERLMYTRGRSPHNSPLVDLGEAVLVCPPLIGIRLIDPILLRSAGYDPSKFGPIGKTLGGLATRWAEWLRQIPGTLVAERVKVVAPTGRQDGDLDVLAIDPARKLAVCLEIKWPVDAWSLSEVLKIEDWTTKASVQLAQVRRKLNSRTATARTPKQWPDISDFRWTWAVGIPRQLSMRPLSESDVHVTSLRYLTAMQVPASLADVASILRTPDLPVVSKHFTVERRTVSLDQVDIHIDTLRINPAVPWTPSASGTTGTS